MHDELHYAAFVEAQVGDVYRLGYEVLRSKWTLPDPSDIWDCSELVEVSYGKFGVGIRDLAAYQYEDTRPIAGLPRIGDLVFLKNNPERPHGIGHVGIITRVYTSNGALVDCRIVEAKGRDYGVVFSTLSAWKRKSTFAGIRRYPDFANHVGPNVVEEDFLWVLAHARTSKANHLLRVCRELGLASAVRKTAQSMFRQIGDAILVLATEPMVIGEGEEFEWVLAHARDSKSPLIAQAADELGCAHRVRPTAQGTFAVIDSAADDLPKEV